MQNLHCEIFLLVRRTSQNVTRFDLRLHFEHQIQSISFFVALLSTLSRVNCGFDRKQYASLPLTRGFFSSPFFLFMLRKVRNHWYTPRIARTCTYSKSSIESSLRVLPVGLNNKHLAPLYANKMDSISSLQDTMEEQGRQGEQWPGGVITIPPPSKEKKVC